MEFDDAMLRFRLRPRNFPPNALGVFLSVIIVLVLVTVSLFIRRVIAIRRSNYSQVHCVSVEVSRRNMSRVELI
ncbi:hypothetical protein AAVH_04571 [Aphelenchoides avenae]|nr:hypothetical protein AAVH_04571 [Aphelenchus avenae]